MSRKLVLDQGTIINCKCRVACDSIHFHTLEHGKDGDVGSSGPAKFDLDRYYFRYYPMQKATHKVTIGCQCSPTINGVPQKSNAHVHIHTIGPKGLQGVEGGLLRDGHPDLGRMERRYIIVVEDCQSCRSETDPHDHAVLEGFRGERGPAVDSPLEIFV